MRAFAWFLGLIALALGAIAALTWPAWDLLQRAGLHFPFHRIADRIALLAVVAGFLLIARRLRIADRASLGYGQPRPLFLRELALGFLLGMPAMLGGVAVMWALGLIEWRIPPAAAAALLPAVLAKRLGSALAVAFLEETLMRGAMLTAIRRESGTTVAVALTSVVYAASHFVAGVHVPAAEVGPGSGVHMLAGALAEFGHPGSIADAFLCLTGVGVLLGLVRVLSGGIGGCIGLHAGWVWVMLVTHELTRPVAGAPLAWMLSRHDGFVGWLLLLWLLPVGAAILLLHARRGGYGSSSAA